MGGIRLGRGTKEKRKTCPPGRRLPSPLHVQHKLVPGFFVVGKSVVALRVKAASVETSQTDIDPKWTVLQRKGSQSQSGSKLPGVAFAPGCQNIACTPLDALIETTWEAGVWTTARDPWFLVPDCGEDQLNECASIIFHGPEAVPRMRAMINGENRLWSLAPPCRVWPMIPMGPRDPRLSFPSCSKFQKHSVRMAQNGSANASMEASSSSLPAVVGINYGNSYASIAVVSKVRCISLQFGIK